MREQLKEVEFEKDSAISVDFDEHRGFLLVKYERNEVRQQLVSRCDAAPLPSEHKARELEGWYSSTLKSQDSKRSKSGTILAADAQGNAGDQHGVEVGLTPSAIRRRELHERRDNLQAWCDHFVALCNRNEGQLAVAKEVSRYISPLVVSKLQPSAAHLSLRDFVHRLAVDVFGLDELEHQLAAIVLKEGEGSDNTYRVREQGPAAKVASSRRQANRKRSQGLAKRRVELLPSCQCEFFADKRTLSTSTTADKSKETLQASHEPKSDPSLATPPR